MTLDATYYDGRSSRGHTVRVEVSGGSVTLSGDGIEKRYRVAEVKVPARLGNTRRILELPGGGQLHCADNDAVDAAFPWAGGAERFVHRLERRWVIALGSAVVAVMALIFVIFVALPWFGDRVARNLPHEAEDLLAKQVELILGQLGVEPSELPRERQEALAEHFLRLKAGLPDEHRLSLEFRRFGGLPNAFALPGGTVVLTDALVELLDEDRLIVAVMAHEIGHHEHRHILRKVVRSASTFVLISLVLGDVTTLSSLGPAVPVVLLNNHFSREFEAEADAYAFELLAERGYAPLDFADAMQRLGEELPAALEGPANYLATHPPTQARIDAAKAADARLAP